MAPITDKIGKVTDVIGAAKLSGKASIAGNVAIVVEESISATGEFLKESIELASRQEDAEKRLAVALGHTSQALLDQASALQQLSNYRDEAIIQQQAFLAAIGFSEEQIRSIIPVAMDLATATGIPLESAVRNTAATFSGLTGELGALVPQLRGLTEEELKAGKAVETMEELFRGQAAGAAETFSGKLNQLAQAWSDVKEQVGLAIVKDEDFNKSIESLTTSVKNMTPGLVTLAEKFVSFADSWVLGMSVILDSLTTTPEERIAQIRKEMERLQRIIEFHSTNEQSGLLFKWMASREVENARKNLAELRTELENLTRATQDEPPPKTPPQEKTLDDIYAEWGGDKRLQQEMMNVYRLDQEKADQEAMEKTIAQEEEWARQSDERLIAHLEEQRRIKQENRKQELADEEAKNELKKQTVLLTFNAMTQMANAFYQLSGKQSKSAFKAYKALALAETIIGTYYAAQKAYESQLIPGDPTSVFRAVMAAVSATAAGMARVAAIKSQTMGVGAAGGGAAGTGGGGGTGGGAGRTLPQATSPVQATAPGGELTINLRIHGDDSALAASLVTEIEEMAGDKKTKILVEG